MSKLLFLSHAGADTEAARALAERLEGSPEAQRCGLKVWFDKKDLKPGQGWQQQLEQALERESTAFAVYVGSRGVINWVDSEVRVALSRTRNSQDYPFIPILSKQCSGSEALPPFARQYQGVIDVENNPEEFAKLIRGATGQEPRTRVQLVEEPFVGLRAFEEKDTNLFFGREQDVDDLVRRLKKTRLLMVVGDSGAGKSSLVKAGFIPRYRGGGLVQQRDPLVDVTVWHVLETRPRNNPFDSLADSVANVARGFGRAQSDIRELRKMIRQQDPQEVADALQDSATEHAKILLVVDQFEELFTLSDKAFREPYIRALLYLAKVESPVEFRIVLTMRRDYYNLCHQYPELYAWLEEKERGAKFSIRRMSDMQLRKCIEKPLAHTDIGDTGVFVNQVLADVGDQPGDLALLEMALTESWRRRSQFSGDLLQAYTSLGGTAGALAHLAEEVFARLDDKEKILAEASFIRLVQLGETGGTTRRVATRDEFLEEAWSLLQKLATEPYGRLLHIGSDTFSKREDGPDQVLESVRETPPQPLPQEPDQPRGETVELSHEALVLQWPRYQEWLQAAPASKRVHDDLMVMAKRWVSIPSTKSDNLLIGDRLSEAIALKIDHPSWLSKQECEFIDQSRNRARIRGYFAKGAVVGLALLAVAAVWFATNANIQKEIAQEAEKNARNQLLRTYWIQGIQARDSTDKPLVAAHYFAKAVSETFESVTELNARLASEVLTQGYTLSTFLSFDKAVLGAVFSKDESRVLTWSEDGTARVWPLSIDNMWPKDKYLLKIEVETGTRLNQLDEKVEVIPDQEWHSLKDQYDKIKNEIKQTH